MRILRVDTSRKGAIDTEAVCRGKLTDVRVEGILEKLLARRTNLRSVCVIVTVATHGVYVPNVCLSVSSHIAEARDLRHPLSHVAKPNLAKVGAGDAGRSSVPRSDGCSAGRCSRGCGGRILTAC